MKEMNEAEMTVYGTVDLLLYPFDLCFAEI